MLRLATAADLPRLRDLMADYYAEAGYPFDPAAAHDCFAAIVRDPLLGRVWIVEPSSLA